MMAMIAAFGIVALLGFAAWRDLLTRTIPDVVSIAIVMLGVIVRAPAGWSALLTSVLIALVVFLVLVPLHSRGVVGGADMKLISALAIGLSPLALYRLIAFVAIAGAILALVYLGMGKLARRSVPVRNKDERPRRLSRRVATIELWRIRNGAHLPYGVAIAVGASFVLLAQSGV